MENFVNRDAEIRLIEDAVEVLLNGQRLLRTPIIEFYGVRGIGKTALLEQAKQHCRDCRLPYIWVDLNKQKDNFVREIFNQAEVQLSPGHQKEVAQSQTAVDATRSLLKQGPLVMLFDVVDTTDTDLLSTMEMLLGDVIEDEKLFVILAAPKAFFFEQERSVARKLTVHPLSALDRKSCEDYFNAIQQPIEPQVRNIIFEWTRGYPVAMNVMVQAVQTGFDPRNDLGQREILARLKTQVILQEILANVEPEKRDRYFSALSLLSVPRRFQLTMMQDLINTFAPELRRDGLVAYFSFMKEITDTAGVMSWTPAKAGYSIDSSVRNLLLLILRLEHPDRYFDIHRFLADLNLRLTREVSGSDRVRYLQEYLYHTACQSETPNLSAQLQQAMQLIINEPVEYFSQFSEEFANNTDLKEASGNNRIAVLSMINQALAQIHRQFASKTSGADRVRFLRMAIENLLDDPEILDPASALKQELYHITQTEPSEIVSSLYEELQHNSKTGPLLGDDIERFSDEG